MKEASRDADDVSLNFGTIDNSVPFENERMQRSMVRHQSTNSAKTIESEYAEVPRRMLVLILAFLFLFLYFSVEIFFYSMVFKEKSVLDALYMTVVTFTTVGYV